MAVNLKTTSRTRLHSLTLNPNLRTTPWNMRINCQSETEILMFASRRSPRCSISCRRLRQWKSAMTVILKWELMGRYLSNHRPPDAGISIKFASPLSTLPKLPPDKSTFDVPTYCNDEVTFVVHFYIDYSSEDWGEWDCSFVISMPTPKAFPLIHHHSVNHGERESMETDWHGPFNIIAVRDVFASNLKHNVKYGDSVFDGIFIDTGAQIRVFSRKQASVLQICLHLVHTST